MSTFEIGEHDFLLNGQPFQVISGSIHYFRVHPDSWRDRIRKAKMMGLNTIETYVAWNFHAPTQDQFLTDGDKDLGRFLDIIADEGLYAIVRPGPYICAEWDNGGLPSWLTAQKEVVLRTNEPTYFSAVERYLHQLAPIIEPRQITRGGSIILLQVENEYGAYGTDVDYLKHLVHVYEDLGFNVPFTTVDQPMEDMLANGTLPQLHTTGSFGSRVAERLARVREHQPTGPLMCSEFWIGWFDHWGAHHHTTTIADSAGALEDLLSVGASVNIYMFHGGTNYGLTNGANDKGVYQPLITSYDYDAPLAEDGSPTEKFWAFRDVISKYAPVPSEVPAARELAPVLSAQLTSAARLSEVPWERMRTVDSTDPADFEVLGHPGGFIHYRTEIAVDGPGALYIPQVRDIAMVFLNNEPVGTIYRDHHDKFVQLPLNAHGTLTVLLEDQGRVNYGDRLGENKGLGPVILNDRELTSWACTAVDLEVLARTELRELDSHSSALAGPHILAGSFELETPTNLYVDTREWGKGILWVNGFNLGRYWARGPQHTMFVPAELLRCGTNSVVVWELHGMREPVLTTVDAPDLGHTDF